MGCSPVSLRADVVHHTRTGGRGGWGGGEWQLVNAYDGVPRVPLLEFYCQLTWLAVLVLAVALLLQGTTLVKPFCFLFFFIELDGIFSW